MPCPSDQALLDLLERRLEASEIASLESHLASCVECRELVSALACQAGAGSSSRPGPPPAGPGLVSAAPGELTDTPLPSLALSQTRALAGRALDDGQVVLERYRIVRLVARGGMGEVYEVDDLALGGRVALKALLGGRPAEGGALRDDLRREAALARRVTHRNVCRLFDVGVDPDLPGEGGQPLAFLTMELLDGPTLRDRLRARRSLAPREAAPLVEQLIAGLKAAHAAGVVHGDFKPANILLVPEGASERVVITDFGLARPVVTAPEGPVSARFAGTPAYMAPEQVQGERASVASDIYALGVVLFEMLTGRWPFVGSTPGEVAFARLFGAPPRPGSLAPSLDPRWERAVLRCLEREPDRRFRSVDEIASALELGGPRVPSRRVIGLALAATVAGALLAAPIAFGGALLSPSPKPLPPGARPRVALTPVRVFRSHPDLAWMAPPLNEALRKRLAEGDDLNIIGEAEMSRAERELGTFPSNARLTRYLGGQLGASHIVTGRVTVSDRSGKRQLGVELQLIDVTTARPAATFREDGTEDDLFGPTLDRLVARVRRQIAGSPAPSGSSTTP